MQSYSIADLPGDGISSSEVMAELTKVLNRVQENWF